MEGPTTLQPIQIVVIVESIIIVILLGVILFISRYACLKKIKKGKEVMTCRESASPDPRVMNDIHLPRHFSKPTHTRPRPTISNHAYPKSCQSHATTTPVGAVVNQHLGQQRISISQNHEASYLPKPLNPKFSPKFNLVVTEEETSSDTHYTLPLNEIQDWNQAIAGFMNDGPAWSQGTTQRANVVTPRHDSVSALEIGPENSQPTGPYHLSKSQTWPVSKDLDQQTSHVYLQSPSRTVSPLSTISNTITHADHGTPRR